MSNFPNLFPENTTNSSNISGGNVSEGGTVTGTVNYPIVALNLYGKSVQDGTPTPEAPVDVVSIGDDGNIKITSCGKNLFKNTANKQTSNGVTFTINADGTAVTANGTASSGAWAIFVLGAFTFKAGKTYVLSGCPAGGDAASTYRMIALVDGKEVIGGDYGEGVTIAVDNDTTVTIRIDVISGYTASNLVFYPMIRFADMSDDYEPYKGSTATITSNLPLCSVNEVRDELIYNVDGMGKIIKRTARISSYNGETIATDYISSTGGLDAGAEVIYILDTPQEKALSSNEIIGLMQLQTFNDMTIIYNDENAEMTAKIATNPFLSEYIFPVVKGLMTNSAAMSAFLGV